MHFYHTISRIVVLLGAAAFLAGCNPITSGFVSSQGNGAPVKRLAAAKQKCGYANARARAVRLLQAAGNKNRNEQRAGTLMYNAEQCMRRHGVRSRANSSYGIGRRPLR